MKRWLIICLLPLFACAQNMIDNPGFEEQGDNNFPKNWNSHCTGGSTAGATDAAPYEGKACGFIHKIIDGTSHVAAIVQSHSIKPNTEYLLTAMCKGRGTLFAYEYGEKGEWLRCTNSTSVHCLNWAPASVLIKTSEKARRLEVRFELFGKETQGDGWIDDVRLGKPVSVPPKPENFQAVFNPENRSVKLTWTPVEGLHYYITRSRYPDTSATYNYDYKADGGSFEDKDIPDSWNIANYWIAAANDWHQISESTDRRQVMLRPQGTKSRIILWTDSVLNKYRRYAEPKQDDPKAALNISLAIREAEAKQIVLYADQAPVKGLKVNVSQLKDADGANAENLEIRLLKVCYSMVRKATCDPSLNLKPGLYADALPPLQGAIDIPLEATQSIWVQAEAKPGCKPGKYVAVVNVSTPDGFNRDLPLAVEVYDFELPLTPTFKSAFAIWPSGIERGWDVKSGTPEWQRLYDKYYWFMIDHRFGGAGTLPYPLRSEQAKAFITDPRVVSFQIPSGYGDNLNLDELKQNADYLRENGWLDKGYVYCYDEPPASKYDYVIDLSKKVHSVGKDIPFIMTVQPDPKLNDYIDIWVPIIGSINWNHLYERRKAGQHIWWYTCCWPKAPYPTYLIDDSGISHRILSWLQAKYSIEGILYWCIDVYTMYRNETYQKECKVWEEAEMFPDSNGDGFLTYPGKQVGVDGPVSSIRLEILRDGNEDVEYFNLYRKLLGNDLDAERQVQEVIAPIATDLTHWNHDPAALEARRDALARRIVELNKR